jgi:hypothetical protein
MLGGGGYGIFDVIRLYKQAKQNPSMLGNLLYQNGRIDQSQLEAMNGMSPQEMGRYMANNGIMGQGFLAKSGEYTNSVRDNMS